MFKLVDAIYCWSGAVSPVYVIILHKLYYLFKKNQINLRTLVSALITGSLELVFLYELKPGLRIFYNNQS